MSTLVNLIAIASANDDMDSNGFNHTLAKIQRMIGQDDGGFAGMWFGAINWKNLDIVERKKILSQYVYDEVNHLISVETENMTLISAKCTQSASEALVIDIATIREEVVSSYTEEEMLAMKDFDTFFNEVDIQNAYEENWDNFKEELKPSYRKIWEEFKSGRLNFDN